MVDDVQENRTILSQMLKELGSHVLEAENGQEALMILLENPMDLVFMDIRMPIMDGFETIKILRTDPRFVDKRPICIAISASPLRQQIQPLLDAGFEDFLAKPFRFEAIYQCLNRFLKVQFEYVENLPQENSTKSPFSLAIENLKLDNSLYQRLRDAAELNDLTELENLLLELRQGRVEYQQLADYFQQQLADYNIDEIITMLEQIQHA
ncbi:response regulator [Thioflexithrix psekupsensis]|uniref:response regulator n=1 Tax=Thioflexithrix psekupsensis TaxID=1570016 RepID=UPI001FD93874|nr:response regulator [Thioflexithrix psekupsensis]